jgi:hypothetical protein
VFGINTEPLVPREWHVDLPSIVIRTEPQILRKGFSISTERLLMLEDKSDKPSKCATLGGKEIAVSAVQYANAIAPIAERREPRSKVTLVRLGHCEKQLFEMISRDDGRQITTIAKQSENANSPMLARFEPHSNVTLKRAPHWEKQWSDITLTDDGMQIESSRDPAKV